MSGQQPITVSEEYLTQLCAVVAEKAAKAAAETAATTAYAVGFQDGTSSAPAQASPKGKSRGRGTQPKKEKVTDNYELDLARVVEMDPRDPRAMGEGPCGTEHTAKKKGNQWARWTECSRCCLRMDYTPYIHSPATSARTENPKNVRDALRELWGAQIWQDMEAKHMQAKIKEIAARKATQPRPKGKAKAKARSQATEFAMNSDEENAQATEEQSWEQAEGEWDTVNQADPPRPAQPHA